MARPKKRTIPGSVYAVEGKLRIKVKNDRTKKFDVKSTGLNDTPAGRVLALEMLENLWMENRGLRQSHEQSDTPKTVAKAWTAYIGSKQATLSAATLKYYEYAYNSVFVRDAPLSADSFEKYIELYLAKTEVGSVTINNVLRAIQIFINFCFKKKWLAEQVEIASENRRKVRSTVDPFTDSEIKSMIELWKTFDAEAAVFAEVMWLTGARLGDMLGMNWSDVDPSKRIITWYNKISKDPEPVPTAPKVFALLNSLPRRADDRIWRWSIASKSSLTRILTDAMIELKIEKRGRGWHEIRKNFCTNIGKLNLPVKDFLTLVRHKSLDTTIQKYLAPDNQIQHSALEKLGNW